MDRPTDPESTHPPIHPFTKTKQEEKEHMDVVHLPFVDSYYNLSVKTAALLRWPQRQVRRLLLWWC